MADALIKAWHGVFDRGSKQAQERLKKVHGHKPEFQAFLKSRGIEGGERSAKQATTSLKKATDTKVAAQKIADMRFKKALQASSDRVREMGRRRREGGEGLGGSLETTKDVIAHIKQYGSIKAGRLGEAMDRTQLIGKVAKDIEKKKAATKIVDRLKTISYGRGAGLNPAKDMKLNPSSPLKTDMSALSNKRHSMNYEEVQIDEVSKAEAEKVLGGAVKEKPKMPPGKQPAGYRYVRGLARRAMKGGVSAIHKSMEKTMAKEEVEQVVEQDDSMEKKEMAQTQLHFIKYAAEEILAFIDMGGEVEEWYQNKLSKVQSEVESLHSYIEGEKRRTGMVKEEEGQIDEKINLAKAKMGDVIKDFYKSKAPQFKGKSMEKRREMAVAAKLGAERGTNEEVEQDDDEEKESKGYSGSPAEIKAKYYHDMAKQKKAKKEKNVTEEAEQMDEGNLSIRTLYNKYADHYTSSEGNSAKRADAVEKTITKVHGPEVMNHLKKAVKANLRNDMDQEENHFERARNAAEKSGSDRVNATVGKNRSKFRKEEAEGTVAVTPKEKALAAHHGDPKKITYGDVIKARLKSAAAKKMGK